jgi:CBS domain-containing protein
MADWQELTMRAGDLAQPFPVVTPDTEALVAAQTMAGARLPGLIVCGDDGHPDTLLPGSQVLRFPDYLQDNPALAPMHSPAVAVVDGDGGTGQVVGAITVSSLLDHLLPAPSTQP